VAETWVMTTVLLAIGASSGGLGNAGTLRLLRLLRLSRMARMAKLLRSFPELLILIKGMASAMRSVIVTLVLLFLLIYVYAIAFRQLTDDTPVGQIYFPDMWIAMHTLWIDGTLLDGPGTIAAMLLKESVVLTIVFYTFVLLAALTVMNMLIGVLCEVVSAVAATEKEQITVATVKDGFTEIIGCIDTDSDNMISKSEFERLLENPQAVNLLNKVDVDVYAFVDLADFLFEDEDGDEPVQMSFSKFMETVLQLRGSNAATVKDIVDLRKFIKAQLNIMNEKMDRKQSVLRRSLNMVSREMSTRFDNDVTDTMPPLVSVASQGGPQQHAGAHSVGIGGTSQLWMQAAEMQGVLSATRDKLDRFISSLPFPSAPTTGSSLQSVRSRDVGPPDAGAGPKIDYRRSCSTADTMEHWLPKPLPGAVGGMYIPGTPRAFSDNSVVEVSEDSISGTAKPPPTKPPRLRLRGSRSSARTCGS